jgi:hypothetical protein
MKSVTNKGGVMETWMIEYEKQLALAIEKYPSDMLSPLQMSLSLRPKCV